MSGRDRAIAALVDLERDDEVVKILIIVGVFPSMVVCRLSAEMMSQANRITANRAAGLPDDTDKSHEPPDLTCQNASLLDHHHVDEEL